MIAGGGFAMMAWRLASHRNARGLLISPPVGVKRGCCARCDEYYRIIDRATQGFGAYRAARRLGMAADNFTVTL